MLSPECPCDWDGLPGFGGKTAPCPVVGTQTILHVLPRCDLGGAAVFWTVYGFLSVVVVSSNTDVSTRVLVSDAVSRAFDWCQRFDPHRVMNVSNFNVVEGDQSFRTAPDS